MLRIEEILGQSPLTSMDDFSAMIEDVAHHAADIIADNAPGTHLPDVLRRSIHQIGPNAWGVASFDDLGSAPEDDAPSGTIKAFLQDYPEYRAKKGEHYWHAPWWYLPTRAKWLLGELRQQGQYGGKAGKAPYWHVMDTGYGRPAWVKGTGYVSRSTGEIQSFVQRRIKDFMGF